MAQNSGQTKIIFQSRKTILELLDKQGYNISNYNNFSLNEIHILYGSEQLDMFLENKTKKKKVYIKYHLGKTLRDKNIYEFIEDLFHIEEMLTNNDTLIIITKLEPNQTLLKFLTHLWETEKKYIVIFSFNRLQFNILNHEMVPPHFVLSQSESNEIRKKYNIMNNEQIPEISRFDPVAQAICLRPGEMCKIIRQSRTSITSEFYRICI